MVHKMTISEICRLSGLAPHTLRFYEKHFPTLLAAERSPGGHRVYAARHLEAIQRILKCIREDKLSIQQAKTLLERANQPAAAARQPWEKPSIVAHPAPNASAELMAPILQKLEALTVIYNRLDQVVDSLLEERSNVQRKDLLTQISSLRTENKEMVDLLQKISRRNESPGIPVRAT